MTPRTGDTRFRCADGMGHSAFVEVLAANGEWTRLTGITRIEMAPIDCTTREVFFTVTFIAQGGIFAALLTPPTIKFLEDNAAEAQIAGAGTPPTAP